MPDNQIFKWEFSLDFFGGIIGGRFLEDEPIIYEAIVKDISI